MSLITAVDDAGIIFNIHPTNSPTLISSSGILDNDIYTPPQVQNTGTINLIGQNSFVSLDPSSKVVLDSSSTTGGFQFNYNVTDDNNVVSNTAQVSYVVVDFGRHSPADNLPTIGEVLVNTTTTIVSSGYINTILGLITSDLTTVPDLTITFALASGSSYAATAGRDYTIADLLANIGGNPNYGQYQITPDQIGPEEVLINFSYNGWSFNIQQSFNIVSSFTPLVSPVDDFFVFNVNSAAGQQTLISMPLTDNDTYTAPQVQNSGTITTNSIGYMAYINGTTKVMTIPSNYGLGLEIFTYTITDENSHVSVPGDVTIITIDFGPDSADDIPMILPVAIGSPRILVTQDLLAQTLLRTTLNIPQIVNLTNVTIWYQIVGNPTHIGETTIAAKDIMLVDFNNTDLYTYTRTIGVAGNYRVYIHYVFDNTFQTYDYTISQSFSVVVPEIWLPGEIDESLVDSNSNGEDDTEQSEVDDDNVTSPAAIGRTLSIAMLAIVFVLVIAFIVIALVR